MDEIIIDSIRAKELLTDSTGKIRMEFWKEVQELAKEEM